MTRVFALFAAVAVAVGLAIGAFVALRDGGADQFADCRGGTVAAGGSAAIGGPFTLTGGDGDRITDAQAITRPTLVYFGYTFCPDFCPTDLSRNALAAEALEKRGIDVGQVFISIDPARDTPEVVRDFTDAIDPKIVGLTGTPEEVDAAAKAYRVFYRKAGDDPAYYLMEHTTFTYLMAPGLGFLEFYPSDARPTPSPTRSRASPTGSERPPRRPRGRPEPPRAHFGHACPENQVLETDCIFGTRSSTLHQGYRA